MGKSTKTDRKKYRKCDKNSEKSAKRQKIYVNGLENGENRESKTGTKRKPKIEKNGLKIGEIDKNRSEKNSKI